MAHRVERVPSRLSPDRSDPGLALSVYLTVITEIYTYVTLLTVIGERESECERVRVRVRVREREIYI